MEPGPKVVIVDVVDGLRDDDDSHGDGEDVNRDDTDNAAAHHAADAEDRDDEGPDERDRHVARVVHRVLVAGLVEGGRGFYLNLLNAVFVQDKIHSPVFREFHWPHLGRRRTWSIV